MRYKQYCTGLVLTLAALFTLPAQAALELELTQGIDSAVPMAVVPFGGSNSTTDIDSVIRSDLNNSGRFRIYNPDDMEQKPSTLDAVDYSYWQGLQLNDLVIGSVKSNGSGYQVDMTLLDVFAGKADSQQAGVLLSEEFQINANQVRGLSHHLSDLVYQKLTGDKGIFSTRIAYVLVNRKNASSSKHFLEVADYDGFNPHQLLTSNQPIMSPAWSPDGKKIAYVSFQNRRSAIYIVDVASGQQTLVSEAPGINGAPSWSPDGKKLALVLFDNNNPKIFVKDLSSMQLTQITQGNSIDTEPSWSPDGKFLLFTSNRGGGPQIYKANVQSKAVKRVSFNGGYNASASYTPDGKNIVFLQGSSKGFNIAVQNTNTGRIRVLTHSGSATSPSIAPNGSMVIYGDNYRGEGMLGMVSIDGKVKLRLPARNGNVQEPAWSPFMGA